MNNITEFSFCGANLRVLFMRFLLFIMFYCAIPICVNLKEIAYIFNQDNHFTCRYTLTVTFLAPGHLKLKMMIEIYFTCAILTSFLWLTKHYTPQLSATTIQYFWRAICE